MMMCKFEHDGDCCNCGSPQYMCKCKPNICGSVVPITNADRIRAMSDEELAAVLCTADFCNYCDYEREDGTCLYIETSPDGRLFDGCVSAALKYLKQPAEEDT